MPSPTPLPPETLWELGQLMTMDDAGDAAAWLDTVTGEVLTVSSRRGLEPDPAVGPDGTEAAPRTRAPLPDWREDERQVWMAIHRDTSQRYLPVPIGASFGAPGVLSAFARTLTDPDLYDEVRDAMHGRGAFRRVREVLRRRGLEDLWHSFEDERLRADALAWLRSEGVLPAEPSA